MGLNKNRIVFLCSGGGGNLRFIHAAIENGWINDAVISAVFTDRVCGANEYASAHSIRNEVLDFSFENQENLREALSAYSPDVIITNVHKILSPNVVRSFEKKLINLHYSILPAFGGYIGSASVRKAVEYGAKFTGATVHFVDESLDNGAPISQVAVPILSSDTFEELMDIVFRCGCLALMYSIDLLRKNAGDFSNDDFSFSYVLKNHCCLFAPPRKSIQIACCRTKTFGGGSRDRKTSSVGLR